MTNMPHHDEWMTYMRMIAALGADHVFDPPPAGARGESSAVGPDAGDPHTRFPPETLGVSEKKLGAEISGVWFWHEPAEPLTYEGWLYVLTKLGGFKDNVGLVQEGLEC